MSSQIANLVRETSISTGTGNLTLSAVNGYQTFATAFGTGATPNVFYYFISDSANNAWEIGTGHMSASTTLVRDTVIASTNSNAAVNFLGGTLQIVNDIPASIQTLLLTATDANTASTIVKRDGSGGVSVGSVNTVTLSGASTPALTVTGTTSVSGANTGDQQVALTNILWVSKNGNDANTGNLAYPFLTIGAAITAATAGTTIMIQPGTYTENVTLKAGVSLQGQQTQSCFVTGTMTASYSGTVYLHSLDLQASSGNALVISGANATNLQIDDTHIDGLSGSSDTVSYTNTNSSSKFNADNGAFTQINGASAKVINISSAAAGSVYLEDISVTNDVGSATSDHVAIAVGGSVVMGHNADQVQGQVTVANTAVYNGVNLKSLVTSVASLVTNSASATPSTLTQVIHYTSAHPLVTGAGAFAQGLNVFAGTGYDFANTLSGGAGALPLSASFFNLHLSTLLSATGLAAGYLDGTLEYNGTHLYVDIGTTRYQLDQQTNATTVVSTQTSTNATFYPTFVASSTTGNQGIDMGTGITFNPSTNNLSTTTFTGALSGNATTATSATSATSATTAANLSGTPALPNGTTATTQAQADGTTKLATTSYVDTAFNNAINGLSAKGSCYCAANTNQVGTYLAGVFTFTAVGTTTIDGKAITATGQRVGLFGQTAGSQNGLYSVTTLGAGGVATVLTRATDYNTSAEVVAGTYTIVEFGTVNAGQWINTTTGAITLDVTSLVFTQVPFSAAASAITGTTLASNVTASSLTSFGASIALGTPASGVATNLTGTATALNIGGNAATATTATSATSATSATTATNANNVATTQTSTNASFYPLFVSSSTNGNQAADLGTGLTFNPSTNNLSTTTFTGALAGNATTATSATAAAGLTSATTTVSVSGATAPSSGQVLTATSSTAATWQTPVTGGGLPIVAAGGTADAITGTYSPALTLTDLTMAAFTATAANATTTPTFAPNGLTAHTITKRGGAALAAGDIPAAGAVMIVEYNSANTRWELANPATPVIANGTVTASMLAAPASLNNGGTVGGTANAITLTPTPALGAYAAQDCRRFKVGATNTSGTVTVAVSGLATRNIKKYIGGTIAILAVGDLLINKVVEIVDDGTQYILLNPAQYTQGADIASASTVDFSAASGDYCNVTGTTTITAITLAQGRQMTVQFSGALTLTNGASLILPSGANITTAAGDTAIFRGEASNVVRCVAYQLANGKAVISSGMSTVTKQIFTSSGTYTPTSGMKYCIVEAVGGGAGGGGAKGTASVTAAGGGGGAGCYARSYLSAATVGASQTVTVGGAGNGGSNAPAGGSTGGDTSLGTLVVAKGGTPGAAGTTSTPAAPGQSGIVAACTGDFTLSGGGGTAGTAAAIVTISPNGGTGGYSFFGGAVSGGQNYSAPGGVSSGVGLLDNSYGSGGNGAGSGSTTGSAGGAGGPGVIIITEFV